MGEDIVHSNYVSRRHFLTEQDFNNKKYLVGAVPDDVETLITKKRESSKSLSRVDRTVVLALLATENLLQKMGDVTLDRLCLSIGSSRGATGLWETYYDAFQRAPSQKIDLHTSPLTTLAHISTEVAAHIKAESINIDNSTTCSTGIQSVINGLAWLKSGMTDKLIAGGAEAPLTPFTLAQVEALKIYSKDNSADFPCRPLSNEENKKNTFTLGEGAALHFIEQAEVNSIKDSDVLIESVGYAYQKPPSFTGIDKGGTPLFKAMDMALKNQISRTPVDLVLVHAPGTVQGDEAELNALKNFFTSQEFPHVFSNKWATGHTYAASASLNIDLACICLKHNYCPDFPYKTVLNNNKPRKIKKVMINATGFGGNAACIILSSPSVLL